MHMLSPKPVVRAASALLCTWLLAAACHTTPDPRPGMARTVPPTTRPQAALDASFSFDAALPAGPLQCGDAPATSEAFSKLGLLRAAAACGAWRSCTFQNAAHVLESRVRTYAANGSESALNDARGAWSQAIEQWSGAELFQFGPVARVSSDKYHGRGLRTYVHPWPDTSRCQVETQVALKGYQSGFDLVFPSARGLYALEYLLFYPADDTACNAGSSAAQRWQSLTSIERALAKRDYAAAAAKDMLVRAEEIGNVWSATGENYPQTLVDLTGYPSEQEALNVVAWALLYVEKEVKDLKLGSYAGVQTAPPNPETAFAQRDIELIRANLEAFRALYEGCDGSRAALGFDDWLVASGNQELAGELSAALQAAITEANAFPQFQSASEAQFVEFYGRVRALTTLVKTRFFGSASPLNLKLPASAASDTD